MKKKYGSATYLWNGCFSLFTAIMLIYSVLATYIANYRTGSNGSTTIIYYELLIPIAIAVLIFSAFQWKTFIVKYRQEQAAKIK